MVLPSTHNNHCQVCQLHIKFLCFLEPLQHLCKRLQVLHHHVVCENADPAVQIDPGLTDDPFARRVFLEGEVQASLPTQGNQQDLLMRRETASSGLVKVLDLDAVVFLSLEQLQ